MSSSSWLTLLLLISILLILIWAAFNFLNVLCKILLMKIIIVAGGSPPSVELLKSEITDNSIIIGVDHGADCLFQYQVIPDLIIGDFDSISKPARDFFTKQNVTQETYPTNKCYTDAELALQKAIQLRPETIVLLGCTGGKRIDHLIGALGLLIECAKHQINSSIKDDSNTITLLTQSTKIYGNPGEQFSLQAYSDTVKNLSITGSKYQLVKYDLKIGEGLTLSNQFITNEVTITFNSGRVLLIRPYEQK